MTGCRFFHPHPGEDDSVSASTEQVKMHDAFCKFNVGRKCNKNDHDKDFVFCRDFAVGG